MDDIDVNKILVSKEEQYGKHNSFKYFIGYNKNDVIRPLYLFISQTTGCIYKFDGNEMTMSLMIKDIQLLKKYNKTWKIDLNTQTTYGGEDKYIKTRMRAYTDSITTNFYNKNGSEKIPEENVPHKCLSIMNLDSIIYAYEKYYPKMFLEECKCMKTKNYINEELKSESAIHIDFEESIRWS